MESFNGWCCLWQRCKGIGVECVRVRGMEMCLPCAADELANAEAKEEKQRKKAKEPLPC